VDCDHILDVHRDGVELLLNGGGHLLLDATAEMLGEELLHGDEDSDPLLRI